MDRLQARPDPLEVLDTHAGAGVYDLEGEAARRSGEAAEGIVRLLAEQDPPAAFAPLMTAVRALNASGARRIYPGSPVLAAARLRSADRYLGCELRPDDHAALAEALRPWPQARALLQDGYTALARPTKGAVPRLVLVDPPFERGDDYRRAAETVGAAARLRPQDVVLVWTPLKDLETLDAFLGALSEAGAASGLVVETRLQPLDNPLRMNGCVLTALAPPEFLRAIEAPAREIAGWIVERLGRAGGEARVGALG